MSQATAGLMQHPCSNFAVQQAVFQHTIRRIIHPAADDETIAASWRAVRSLLQH